MQMEMHALRFSVSAKIANDIIRIFTRVVCLLVCLFVCLYEQRTNQVGVGCISMMLLLVAGLVWKYT